MSSSPGQMRFRNAAGELRFVAPRETIEVFTVSEVLPALHRIQSAVNDGAWAAGLLAYEAAPAFDAAFECHPPGKFPLLYFGIYGPPERVSPPDAAADTALPREWRPLVTEAEYRRTVQALRDHIAAGDTYQVNYTFPLETGFNADPDAAFDALCAAQGAPGGLELRACVHTPRFSVLSLSPEIFFTLDCGTITVCPMKGTRPRGRHVEEDRRFAQDLRESPKDRAENLMIVDLLRNDLGRIAENASVTVEEMFQVRPWPTVWQMSSTISARTSAGLPEILAALFPSGSVTGAPKVNTMRLIRKCEPHPRGVYCGTMGYLSPEGKASFNVAIRTLTIDRETGAARYPIGSGITWYSSARDEYRECLDKARVLHYRQPEFDLLETMRAECGAIPLLDLHLARLGGTAEYFGFSLDLQQVRRTVADIVESIRAPHKLRLLVARDGSFAVEQLPLPENRVWTVALAHSPVDSGNIFLFHKTTHRGSYDDKRAECPACDDVLLWNERGELTESTLANIVVEIAGKRYTPPVSCGLLGGVFRKKLLDEGKLSEQILYKSDLQRASGIYLINSVRGWIEVNFADGQAPPATAPGWASPE